VKVKEYKHSNMGQTSNMVLTGYKQKNIYDRLPVSYFWRTPNHNIAGSGHGEVCVGGAVWMGTVPAPLPGLNGFGGRGPTTAPAGWSWAFFPAPLPRLEEEFSGADARIVEGG
jgi:hypothetical protein